MRLLLALALTGCVFGAGDDAPASGKHWKRLVGLDRLAFGSEFTPDGHLLWITPGGEGRVFLFDPVRQLWDDHGEAPEAGLLRGFVLGDQIIIIEDDSPTVNTYGAKLYRLDDQTWTRLGTSAVRNNYVPDADGSVWRFSQENPTTIEHHTAGSWDDADWTRVATLPDHWIPFRDGDRILARDSETHSIGILRGDGAIDNYLTCGTVQATWCEVLTGPHVNRDETMTFASGTPDRQLVTYRVALGGTPAIASYMPHLDGEADSPTNVFQVAHDADDNAYMIFGMNQGELPHLFTQRAGGTDWTEGDRAPVIAFTLLVSPIGEIYGYTGSGDLWKLD